MTHGEIKMKVMTMMTSSTGPTLMEQDVNRWENCHRFVKLELAKVKRQINLLSTSICEAKVAKLDEWVSKYTVEKSDAHYHLTILKIADEALKYLELLLEQQALMNRDWSSDDLTDVDSNPSPASDGKHQAVNFDRARSPSSWGCPD